jgi:dimeric dUTPase (all-alpha-NTP-PPase superfamily)
MKLTNDQFNEMKAGFESWAKIQRFVSEHNGPIEEINLPVYTLATIVELSEFLQETDWKPWKVKSDEDITAIAMEFADILAFLGVIINQLAQKGLTVDDLIAAYKIKSEINVARFKGEVEGYQPRSNSV